MSTAVSVATYTRPTGSTLANVYAVPGPVRFDPLLGIGSCLVRVYNAAHYNGGSPDPLAPVEDTLTLTFGATVSFGGKSVTLPSLAQFKALAAAGVTPASPPAGADGFAVITALLLGLLVQHPQFAGAAVV